METYDFDRDSRSPRLGLGTAIVTSQEHGHAPAILDVLVGREYVAPCEFCGRPRVAVARLCVTDARHGDRVVSMFGICEYCLIEEIGQGNVLHYAPEGEGPRCPLTARYGTG